MIYPVEKFLVEVVVMANDSRSQVLNEKVDALKKRVAEMEPGGDLEGVIEDGLSEINKYLYEDLLSLRDQVALSKADFSPSAMSQVSKTNESGKNKKAAGEVSSR